MDDTADESNSAEDSGSASEELNVLDSNPNYNEDKRMKSLRQAKKEKVKPSKVKYNLEDCSFLFIENLPNMEKRYIRESLLRFGEPDYIDVQLRETGYCCYVRFNQPTVAVNVLQ